MKKIIICLLAIAATILPAAAQMRWAGSAGVNFNNMVFKQDLVTVGGNVGCNAGILGEMIFPGIGFGLDVGLQYNMQGAKVNLGERKVWSDNGYGSEDIRIHTISIPLHLRFKYTRLNGLEDKIAPFVYGGPEFNIQAGHSKCDAIKFSGGDLSMTVGGGVELFKRWQVYGGYTWGMTYSMKTKLLDDFSACSRQGFVRVAYFF